MAKFGINSASPADARYDFSVLRMDSDLSRSGMEADIRAVKESMPQVLVLLDRAGVDDDRELAARLRVVRGLGVSHYGYSPDDYAASKPAFQVVAPEMSASLQEAREK